MSVYQNASFSVDQYDRDGDIVEEGVFVHLGATILQFSGVKQLDGFIEKLKKISNEVKENY
jgi:hypothetical protein